jgi:hypothetical protein
MIIKSSAFMMYHILVLFVLVTVFALAVVFYYQWLKYSPPNLNFFRYVIKICSPKPGDYIHLSLLRTLGYLRRATIEFYLGILRTIGIVSSLSRGKMALDAKIFTLDMVEKSLLHDYILLSQEKPLILNIGSYT